MLEYGPIDHSRRNCHREDPDQSSTLCHQCVTNRPSSSVEYRLVNSPGPPDESAPQQNIQLSHMNHLHKFRLLTDTIRSTQDRHDEDHDKGLPRHYAQYMKKWCLQKPCILPRPGLKPNSEFQNTSPIPSRILSHISPFTHLPASFHTSPLSFLNNILDDNTNQTNELNELKPIRLSSYFDSDAFDALCKKKKIASA